jgi:hypothetical protein
MAKIQETDIGKLFVSIDKPDKVIRLISVVKIPVAVVKDIDGGKMFNLNANEFEPYRRLVPEKRRYRHPQPQQKLPEMPVKSKISEEQKIGVKAKKQKPVLSDKVKNPFDTFHIDAAKRKAFIGTFNATGETQKEAMLQVLEKAGIAHSEEELLKLLKLAPDSYGKTLILNILNTTAQSIP